MRTSSRSVLLQVAYALTTFACSGGALSAATPALPGVGSIAAPATPAKKSETTVESIVAARNGLQKEIGAARAELTKLPENASADSARWLTQETALLERLDAVYADQQRTWEHAKDLGKEAVDVEERTRALRPPETTFKAPYDLTALDQLYAERDYLEQAAEALKRDVANAESMLLEARDNLEEKERDRRSARGATDNPAKVPGSLRLAELESRVAEETLALREKALKTLKLQQSLLKPKQKLLTPRFVWLRAHLTVAAASEPASPEKLKKRIADLDKAIAAAKAEAEKSEQNVIATERRALPDKEKATDELGARRALRQIAHLALSVLTAQRERMKELADVTTQRRRVLQDEMSVKELRALAEVNQTEIDQRTRDRLRETTELFRNRGELQEWQSRLTAATSADEKVTPWNLERVRRLSAWIELSQTELNDLDRLRTERNRLQEEIRGRVNLFSWRDATAIARENIVEGWNYEVFSVQDQPVRIKTLLAVFLLVILGYHASRWVSEFLSRRVFMRMGMATGRRAAWQSLWFYALFVIVLVAAFNLFHISLTQFSVVSGALAVGIGFGSQNLISNFISGIILLIERPVNQGDVIEIDGRQVTVERMGVRSTIVRTLDNTHMVVPNSRLLEQPVVNWTLSDEVIRKQIRVGVAYDSPSRKVEELLHEILSGVESVRKEPAPTVKFIEFGESSLNFVIYFWRSLADHNDPENELRHRIAEVFAREKIIMAFPQRDVHLETTKPLEVILARHPSTKRDHGGASSAAEPTPPNAT